MFMQSTTKTSRLAMACLVSSTIMSMPMLASATDKGLEIKPLMPKVKKFYGTNDYIPNKNSGAIIEVYGQNGKYDAIGNLSDTTTQPWKVTAKCVLQIHYAQVEAAKAKAKKTNSKVKVTGFDDIVLSTQMNVNDLVNTIDFDPVQVCNGELAKRATKTGKSRTYWQKWGFVVKMDNALTGRAEKACSTIKLNPKKIGKPHIERASAKAPVYVACMPSNLSGGKKPQPGDSKNKPKPRPGWLKVKMNPIADIYKKNCPAYLRLEAEVLAPRSMTVRYRYVGTGWKTPVREKQLIKGRQVMPPATQIIGKKPKRASSLSGKKDKNAPDYSGVARLEILQTGKNSIFSKPVRYNIYCGKTKPQKPKPMKFKSIKTDQK